MAVQWKFKNTGGGNVPAGLENRVQTLETDNTTNKTNIATNTTNITTLQNRRISWTQLLSITNGNVPKTEQTLTNFPTLENNHTYVLKMSLKTDSDKMQEYCWIFEKEDINWKVSPTFTFYQNLDYTTKTGEFKIVLGMGANTRGKFKIAQPANQTVSVANGLSIKIGEII